MKMAACASELRAVALRCLGAALRDVPWPQDTEVHGPSVFDAFRYVPSNAPSVYLAGHTDPGFLTLEPRASSPGLEVCDGQGMWRVVEPLLSARDLVVFAGDALQGLTRKEVRSGWHRVVGGGVPREALAFELRCVADEWFDIAPGPEG